MNNRVNYTFVGLIVLFGIVMMAAFAYWMLRPSTEAESKKYAINFDESVLGLNLDAPVKYRGISVGKVISIGINERDAQQVRVVVDILKTTPVKSDTVAKLTAQGITGLSYINLSLGSNDAEPLRIKEGDKYPIIKTIPSFFENFEKSLGSVSSQLSSTLDQTQKLLNDDNQKQMSLLLERSANVLQKMEKLLDDKTITHLQSSAQNMDEFSYKLNAVMPNIDNFIIKSEAWENKISTSFESIMGSYVGIRGSMDEIKRAVASGEFNIKEISSEVLPTMNSTFLEMQELMINVEETLKNYNKSPSDILYKQRENREAPGER